jgi:hypothetical protein
MAFMQKQVYVGTFFEVDTTTGVEVIPCDVAGIDVPCFPAEALQDYLEGAPMVTDEPCEVKEGWLARWHAPGYMDCTSWTAHKTEQAAHAYLDESDENDEDPPEA